MIQQLQPTLVFEVPDPESLRKGRILYDGAGAPVLPYADEGSVHLLRRYTRFLAAFGAALACTSIATPILTLFVAESAGFGSGLFAAMLNPFIMWIKAAGQWERLALGSLCLLTLGWRLDCSSAALRPFGYFRWGGG